MEPCFLCGRAEQATLYLDALPGRWACLSCARRVSRLILEMPLEFVGKLWPSARTLTAEVQRSFREGTYRDPPLIQAKTRETTRSCVSDDANRVQVEAHLLLFGTRRVLGLESFSELNSSMSIRLLFGTAAVKAAAAGGDLAMLVMAAAARVLLLDARPTLRASALRLLLTPPLAQPGLQARLRQAMFPD